LASEVAIPNLMLNARGSIGLSVIAH
jgi:hypothetical protein